MSTPSQGGFLSTPAQNGNQTSTATPQSTATDKKVSGLLVALIVISIILLLGLIAAIVVFAVLNSQSNSSSTGSGIASSGTVSSSLRSSSATSSSVASSVTSSAPFPQEPREVTIGNRKPVVNPKNLVQNQTAGQVSQPTTPTLSISQTGLKAMDDSSEFGTKMNKKTAALSKTQSIKNEQEKQEKQAPQNYQTAKTLKSLTFDD